MGRQPNARVYRGDDGKWHWRVRAANGQIVAYGESHDREKDARQAMYDALDAFNEAAQGED